MRRILCFCILLLTALSFPVTGSSDQVSFGGHIKVPLQEKMEGDIVIFGGTTEIMGELIGDITALGGQVQIYGRVNGDLVTVGSQVILFEGAYIAGDVKIVSGSISREPNVHIGRSYSQITPLPRNIYSLPRLFTHAPFFLPLQVRYSNIILSFFFQLLLVLLISYFFSRNVEVIRSTFKENLGQTLLIGLVGFLILIPLMIFLAITILGIPLAILTPVFYWIAISLGRTGIYLYLGEWAQQFLKLNTQKIISTTLLGFLVYFVFRLIIRFIPFIGPPIAGIISFLLYMVAFGSTMQSRFGTGMPWFKRHS